MQNKKLFYYLTALIISAFIFTFCTNKSPKQNSVDLTQFVDPFIGSGGEIGEGHGNVFPGAAYPFGMIQLSPDNGGEGWAYCSGYHYGDSMIAGFSHTHLSGTGVGDLADISVMPTQKEIKAVYFEQDPAFLSEWAEKHHIPADEINDHYLVKYRSSFSQENETASPGYYAVLLNDDNILAEMTVTEFVGWHRYTFQEKREPQHLILDLGFHINRDKPVAAQINIISDRLITGYRFSAGWANDQKVFFAMRFSKPIQETQFFKTEEETKNTFAAGEKIKGVFSFDPETGEQLMVQTAISSASIEGALANLQTSDSFNWDFEAVKNAADQKWNDELSKVRITTDDKKGEILFYTSLYRSFITPYRFSDVNGYYKGYNGTPERTDHIQYTIFSLWDTFRALKPLFTLLQPKVYEDIIYSMLAQYQQTGILPYWEIVGNEGGSMIGYHSVPVIADAIQKGIGDFDKNLALEAMKAASQYDRKGLGLYRKYGYVPTDSNESGTVSKTIEFAFDDWCIAQTAKTLNDTAAYRFYMKSAMNYKNVFDREMKLMHGKKRDGSWSEDFQPTFAEYGNPHFVEGNSWHYTFFVPQDVPGLIEETGGPEDFEMMLDSLFNQSSELLGEDTEDVTGLIGQYAHGNEPGHHVPYLYNYVGKSSKTQLRVNQVLETMYDTTPAGLCGNEDCGQISAWYVWSSLGFYPVNPVSGEYQFGSPQFEEAVINLPNGNEFIIKAHNVSDENIYIKNVKLNNQQRNVPFIRYSEIIEGGILEFEMTDEPVNFSENQIR